MKSLLFFSMLMFSIAAWSQKQSEPDSDKAQQMEWFKDAKLGIFIHYGIYAVNGIDESWSFFNGYLSHQSYMEQLKGFTASNYDPSLWAETFKKAGARYAVLTTKHHDGIALWETKTDHLNVVDNTPAKRDLVAPFVTALRQNNLKVGLYYSLIDWSHPEYPAFTRTFKRYTNDTVRWAKFVDFYFAQMRELSSRFNPDLYWFDGDWEHSSQEWRAPELKSMLLKYNPNLIVNSRLREYGDYATPEQGVPIMAPHNNYWELCLTINDSWGYQHNDQHFKSPWQVLRTFVDCISMGGNLLLDVGPTASGEIPAPQLEVLQELGKWNKKHAEAVYGTRAGLPPGHFLYPTAYSKDYKTLFLYVDAQPQQPLLLKGISGDIRQVRVVGQEANLDFNFDNDLLSFNLPPTLVDPMITVVAVDFKSRPHLADTPTSFYQLMTSGLSKNTRWHTKHSVLPDHLSEGISSIHYNGVSALSANKDVLYLFVNGKPNGPLILKGLKNNINRIWVVGNGTKLKEEVFGKLYWSNVPGMIYIDLPTRVLDEETTVVAVLLDGPIELYEERGQVIESN